MGTMEITQGALNNLVGALATPQWYEGGDAVKHAYQAGKLLTETFEPFMRKETPKEETAEETEAYVNATLKVEIGKAGRKTCKAALEYRINKGQFVPNKWVFELMEIFGLAPVDEEDED